MEFEWDPREAAANLAKHRVSFEEAATVFGDPLGRILADPLHSAVEDRFVLLGVSKDRRLLAVLYIEGCSHHQRAARHTPREKRL